MIDLFLQTAKTIHDLHMAKQAQLEPESEDLSLLERVRGRRKPKYHYLFGKRIGSQELENIRKSLEKQRPRTEAERDVQRIVGARPTTGQIMRAGTVGATGGLATHLIGSALEGGVKWKPDLSEGVVKGLLRQKGKAVLHPRSLARASAVGAIIGGAVPVARRLWDIQTARTSPESF